MPFHSFTLKRKPARLYHLLHDQFPQRSRRHTIPQEQQKRHVDGKRHEKPRPELGRQHAVHAPLHQGQMPVDLPRRDKYQVRQPLHDDGGENILHGVGARFVVAFEHGGEGRREAGLGFLAVEIGFAVQGGGEDGGAGVVEGGDGAFKAHAAETLHALRFESGQDVRFGWVERSGAGQAEIEDGEEFFFFEGGDSFSQEHGFDVGVLVEVADFGDGAEADGKGGEALCAAVFGEVVEEAVGGCVVALCGGADGAGDGGCQQEKVDGRGGSGGGHVGLECVMQVPRTLDFGVDRCVPAFVGHGGPQCFVKAHGCLDDAADGPDDGIHAALDDRGIDNIAPGDYDVCTGFFEVFD